MSPHTMAETPPARPQPSDVVTAFNGPRTLVSEQVGSVRVGDPAKRELPVFTPSIPNGGVVLPLAGLLSMLAQQELTDDQVRTARRALIEAGAPLLELQVIITESAGCIYTVSDAFACELVEVLWGTALADQLQSVLEAIIVRRYVETAPDPSAGKMATFESLSRLHRIAGSPRGNAPGHWYYRQGKAMAEGWAAKGVWKTQAGEWMADGRLALDYAQMLFPAFRVWMTDLMFADPVTRWRLQGAMERLLGASFVTVPFPQDPEPKPSLRLVHDADRGDGGPA